MSRSKRFEDSGSFSSNAIANLVRAISGSAENIAIPLTLVFLLPKAEYGVWAVCFSVAAYVIYLDMGLQATVQANVAMASGSGARSRAVSIASSGSRISAYMGVFCVVAAIATGVLLPWIYPQIPSRLLVEARLSLAVIVVGQVGALQVNVLSAYWAGIGRASLPAFVMAGARAVSLGSALLFASARADLPLIAAGYSVPILAAAVFLWIALRRRRSEVSARDASVGATDEYRASAGVGRSLLKHSAPLLLWNTCLLLATGSGVVIVGRIDFDSVAVFTLGNMCFIAINGVNYALVTPLLSVLGRQSAVRVDATSSQLTLRFVHLDTVLLACLGVSVTAIALVAAPLFEFDSATFVLVVGCMALAALVRLSFTPLQAAIVSTNSQRFVLWQPILDAAISLTLIVILGDQFGVVGVASGFVVSAVAYAIVYMTVTVRKSPITRGLVFTALVRVMWLPVTLGASSVSVIVIAAVIPEPVPRISVAVLTAVFAVALLVCSSPVALSLVGRIPVRLRVRS